MTPLQKLKYWALGAFLITASIVTVSVAKAQNPDDTEGLIPAQATITIDAELATGEETHPPLRLTPDRSEIINLDKTAGRIIIGNESHINILMDSSKRLVVVPRIPGATHFSILDQDGKIIMQRHVIVANPKEQYVRIREPCRGADACMPIRMFYCPDLCHEIAILGEDNTAFSGSIAGAEEEDSTEIPTEFPLPTDGGE